MKTERSCRTWLADSLVTDRRTVLKSFAASAMAGAFAAGRTGAQADPAPSPGHLPEGGTPEPLVAGGAPALDHLLTYVPRSMIDPFRGERYWSYADIAQQFAALTLHHDADGPAWDEEPWFPAVIPLATFSGAYMWALDQEFVDAIGFQPLGTDQTLLVGEPLDTLTLIRGTFDERQLAAAWTASGYARTATEAGDPVWSLHEENDFDFEHPIGGRVFSEFNNLALVDGKVLVGAATLTLLEEAIATRQSGTGSLASDPELTAALQTMPPTMVSTIDAAPILAATFAGGDGEATMTAFADSDAAVGPMPVSRGMTLGLTAGAVNPEDVPFDAPDPAAGEGLALIRLRMGSAEDAEQAVKVVEYRWGRMSSLRYQVPYADVMEIMSAQAVGEIAAFDFIQLRGAHSWIHLLPNRDLLPFVPSLSG
jgi:hypothetical protein